METGNFLIPVYLCVVVLTERPMDSIRVDSDLTSVGGRLLKSSTLFFYGG